MKKFALFAILGLAALSAAPAYAAPVDLKQVFREADGKGTIINQLAPAKDAQCGEIKGYPCLTLGSALFHALLQPYQDEPTLSGEDKFRRGVLAMKVLDKKSAEFTPQEVGILKLVVGKFYSPLVILRVYEALEPGSAIPK